MTMWCYPLMFSGREKKTTKKNQTQTIVVRIIICNNLYAAPWFGTASKHLITRVEFNKNKQIESRVQANLSGTWSFWFYIESANDWYPHAQHSIYSMAIWILLHSSYIIFRVGFSSVWQPITKSERKLCAHIRITIISHIHKKNHQFVYIFINSVVVYGQIDDTTSFFLPLFVSFGSFVSPFSCT